MSNLRLQGSTYHARLTIPKDVRIKFGKKVEFSQSLETGDLKLAKYRGGLTVAGWKLQIALAREGNPTVVISEWSKSWAKELRNADHSNGILTKEFGSSFGGPPTTYEVYLPSDREQGESAMYDEVGELVESGQFSESEAIGALAVARGEKVILVTHREDYLKQYANHRDGPVCLDRIC